MYHEILHKKYKFKNSGNRSYHHTKEFRKREKEFEDPDIESKLKQFLTKQKIRSIFRLPKII